VKQLLDSWFESNNGPMEMDKRFVYYLLAAKQVCLVPISSFCSDLMGFRMTLLEENDEIRDEIFKRIKEGIEEFCGA
jgi:alanine-synthesizing transaminase